MKIERIEELLLNKVDQKVIQRLLVDNFEFYPQDRLYYLQPPYFRTVARDAGKIIGHAAVDYRQISLEGENKLVFMIADVCVKEEYRDRGVASKIILHIEKLALKKSIEFLIAISKDHRLYLSQGFKHKVNKANWLMFHNNKSLGISNQLMDESLLVKSLTKNKWNDGLLDFQGPLF
jgi:predicted N-acetyltransferase YhbS